LAGELWAVKKERIRRSSVHGKSPSWDLRSVSKITFIIILFFFFYPSLDIGGMINACVQMCVCVCARACGRARLPSSRGINKNFASCMAYALPLSFIGVGNSINVISLF